MNKYVAKCAKTTAKECVTPESQDTCANNTHYKGIINESIIQCLSICCNRQYKANHFVPAKKEGLGDEWETGTTGRKFTLVVDWCWNSECLKQLFINNFVNYSVQIKFLKYEKKENSLTSLLEYHPSCVTSTSKAVRSKDQKVLSLKMGTGSSSRQFSPFLLYVLRVS